MSSPLLDVQDASGLAPLRHRSDRALQILFDHLSSEHTYPQRLLEAMRYAVEGGKRFRAMLVYGAAKAMSQSHPAPVDEQALDQVACSVELIHAYSLVHDDLPAMDDDDLRRGKPSCHKQYDEITAILAGDALQSLAFECLTKKNDLPDQQQIQLIALLARAIGGGGMVGGQFDDCYLPTRTSNPTVEELTDIHRMKSGALMRAATCMGGIVGGAVGEQIDLLAAYADCVGLAFQLHDDVLDSENDNNAARDMANYVHYHGTAGARAMAQQWQKESMTHLAVLSRQADILSQLAQFTVARTV